MKTTKLTVNRTPQRPQGVELEVVQPETALEKELACYLLAGLLRDEVRQGRVKLELPEQFKVESRGDGSFLVSSLPRSSQVAPYYEPSKSLALVLLRRRGAHFELVYSDGKARAQLPNSADAAQGLPADVSADMTIAPTPIANASADGDATTSS